MPEQCEQRLGSSSKKKADNSTSPRRSKTPKSFRTSKSVSYGRLLFVAGLAVVAASLGYLTFHITTKSEVALAEGRFDSIAERALRIAQLVVEEKKLTTDSLAQVAAAANPNAKEWPNVYIEGFEEISTSLRLVTEGQEIAFCPMVKPGGEEQASFEEFAYDFYENTRRFDNDPGVYSFGKGIFSFGNEAAPDNRYHDTTGETYYGSQNKILVPAFQLDQGYHPSLLLNVHFEQTRGDMIDEILTCSEDRGRAGDHRECGSITDLMHTQKSQHTDPGPAALIFVPTYPKFDNMTLTGFIVAKMIWHEVLRHGFSADVDGLDCVLKTKNYAHTYRIEGGEAIYTGPGQLHDPNARFTASALINTNYFSNSTLEYTLEIYSTDEYIDSYSTSNPWVTCIGALAIMLFTSTLFFLYDYFVRREFDDKRKLLEAKRQFVRFVSHEVRTPLNTVCMGLSLLQDDFAQCLGITKMRKGDEIAKKASVNNPAGTISDISQVENWMTLSIQINQNAEVAIGVLNDLLNYDKIQMGALSLELGAIPIWTTVEQTLSEFKIAALEKKIFLDLDLTPLILASRSHLDVESGGNKRMKVSRLPPHMKDCKIVGDNIRISQVLRNLISNGLKFSKAQGHLTVRVSEKKNIATRKTVVSKEIVLDNDERIFLKERGRVIIEVIDDGVGMTPGQTKTVFNDGTQFNSNKLQSGGGSGLGLSIAKGIAKQHGGSLTCSSDGLGTGSTFTLTLPLYQSALEHTSKLTLIDDYSNHSNKSRVSPFDRELRVLVVDDSSVNRKLCMNQLERRGHTCEGACDGTEAVQKVKDSLCNNETPFDCILLDYEMPNLNGPDACFQIRKLGCSAFVVGVTGNFLSEDVAHFRQCGANYVLPKPFRMASLEQQWVEHGIVGSSNHTSASSNLSCN